MGQELTIPPIADLGNSTPPYLPLFNLFSIFSNKLSLLTLSESFPLSSPIDVFNSGRTRSPLCSPL